MNEPMNAPTLFATPVATVTRRADGAIFVDSPTPLEPARRCIGEYLELWAQTAPERDFLVERAPGGNWTAITYSQTRDKVYRIATWLLTHAADRSRPLVVLSDNSIEHGLLMLACMHIGMPYSGISPAYSLVSKDHAKIKTLIARLEPAVLYVADPGPYTAALNAIEGLHDALLVVGSAGQERPGATRFLDLLAHVDEQQVRSAFEVIGPDTVAKILFTSGSTSSPKGVINTQRMLTASQQAKAQVWPFLAETPPVLLDWLPWNHTFGGNHNFNLILAHGGTLYLDSGKPVPGLFDASLANLRDVAPTLYLNVPRAFDMLIPVLRSDDALRKKFFSRLQVVFFAAAALPQHLWEAMAKISRQELGYAVPMVTAWGSTETSPLSTDCHYQADRAGVIGVPVPGVSLKLVPNGDKLEVRVRGPNVMPGYFKQPELSAAAFDEDGYYRIGDAVRLVDEAAPEKGLQFDGRVTEDFKLTSGTWVSVGSLRLASIEKMAPLAQDVVVTGHDRDEICLLVFPNLAACRQVAGLPADAPVAEALAHPRVREHVRSALAAAKRDATGSSTCPVRAILMEQPASVDAQEITDKGYVNQSAVLKNRADLVDRLYARDGDPSVISV
ncbi:feruloyl-CoA synthase [Massilia niastensis]|uniref:feruloyl-CoA synthase n=1 Tax=Massilia niastensis TaxID=544911 RepID=UPI0003787A18|nr:feruloyl-CoA synthase [Massilia niastensis]